MLIANGVLEKAEGYSPPCCRSRIVTDAGNQAGRIKKRDIILLNVTGGGFKRLKRDYSLYYLQPDVVVDSSNVDMGYLLSKLGHKL